MNKIIRSGVLLLLIFTSLAYSRLPFPLSRKEPASIPEIWSLDVEVDVLSLALSKAFPSFQHNPAYASALSIFRSLESKPSCHRSAAASLVLNCSALEGKDVQDGGLKIAYAAQLAVCEFEATGISFPRECNGLGSGKGLEVKVMKCVKKLEERPQWWTTLSNNIQSTVVMCAAVKHEIEKDQLLVLHKNITDTQKSLFAAMDMSLNEVWESIAAQKKSASTWRRVLDDVLGELIETKSEVTDAMKTVGMDAIEIIRRFAEGIEITRLDNQKAIIGLDQLIHHAKDGLESLEAHTRVISERANITAEEISIGTTAQYEVIKLNSELVQQINKVLSSEMGASINALLYAIDLLSVKMQDSLVKIEKFEDNTGSYSLLFTSLSTSYRQLAQSHINLTASLGKQEESQQRLLSSLEVAHRSANTTIERLTNMMERLGQSLDDADVKIRSWEMNSGQTWIPLGIVVLGFGILLGKEGGQAILVLVLVFAMVYLVLFGSFHFKDLVRILVLGGMKPLSFEITATPDGKYHEISPQNLWAWVCGLIAVAVIVSTVSFAAFRRHRHRASGMSKDLE